MRSIHSLPSARRKNSCMLLPQDDKTSADYYFDSYSHFGKWHAPVRCTSVQVIRCFYRRHCSSCLHSSGTHALSICSTIA